VCLSADTAQGAKAQHKREVAQKNGANKGPSSQLKSNAVSRPSSYTTAVRHSRFVLFPAHSCFRARVSRGAVDLWQTPAEYRAVRVSVPVSELTKIQAAQSIQCDVCKQTFQGTSKQPM
jgi:ribosomal protein L37AE/L43A